MRIARTLVGIIRTLIGSISSMSLSRKDVELLREEDVTDDEYRRGFTSRSRGEPHAAAVEVWCVVSCIQVGALYVI